MEFYFSDIFNVSEDHINEYGAFNISLVADLPLFIDPFLLFHSDKDEYKFLHDNMITYLQFLRDKSSLGLINGSLIQAWYMFPEVKQTWFGFSEKSNRGRGLGRQFAKALNENLNSIFINFGLERITRGTHLEKLCLINRGVGRDMISDFTTNLIKYFLLTYTENFAKKYIDTSFLKRVSVPKVKFDYETERWYSKIFNLPYFEDDYVLLTPIDILTKDETWINRNDLLINITTIPGAIDNNILRAEINNYFYKNLPKKPKREDYEKAAIATIRKYPKLVDYYIRYKEDNGNEAMDRSINKVRYSQKIYIDQCREFYNLLSKYSDFYNYTGNTTEETKLRIIFLKDVIENKGGHKIFYIDGVPVRKENDVQILFRLTWIGTLSDISREVNNGRGPADFKISRGSLDKTLVEFKLASNSQLKRNLMKQLDIYKKASDAKFGFKVIIYFTESELKKVEKILFDLGISTNSNIILIDARYDNKPSGSKA